MSKIFKNNILLWTVSTFCLAFCVMVANDLVMLRSFGKWDGLWFYFCPTKYLMALDKVFILLSSSAFIILLVRLWRKYNWYALLVFIAALPCYGILLTLHVLVLNMVH